MTPNKKSRQWVVRSSTTHRRDFLLEVGIYPTLESLEMQGEATALGHTDCECV